MWKPNSILFTYIHRYDDEKQSHLYGEFYMLLMPIIEEFTSDIMLTKLARGLHTDDLESLFSSIHSQHSKKKVCLQYWAYIMLMFYIIKPFFSNNSITVIGITVHW